MSAYPDFAVGGKEDTAQTVSFRREERMIPVWKVKVAMVLLACAGFLAAMFGDWGLAMVLVGSVIFFRFLVLFFPDREAVVRADGYVVRTTAWGKNVVENVGPIDSVMLSLVGGGEIDYWCVAVKGALKSTLVCRRQLAG